MAHEYLLSLDTGLKVSQVQDLLGNCLGLVGGQDGLRGPGVVSVHVFSPSPVRRSSVKEVFGFEPDTSILFRLDKFEHTDESLATVVRSAILLLHETQRSGVLLLNAERAELLRTREGWVVSDDDEFWNPSLMEMVPEPFKRMPLPLL